MSLNCLWKSKPLRRRNTEINIWRLQALFQNFRKILQFNNAVLEEMAYLEQTLGGEFIFDWNYLAEAVRNLATKVHHISYNLNALTGNAYVPLYDIYQEIRTILDDILSGNTRALTDRAVLSLDEIGWELEPLVGLNLVCLAELQHHQGIKAAGGFVLTSEGCRSLCREDGDDNDEKYGFTTAEIRNDLHLLFKEHLGDGQPGAFSMVVTRIDEQIELVKEVARFSLHPAPGNRRIEVSAADGFEDLTMSLNIKEAKLDAVDSGFWPGQYVRCVEQIFVYLFSRLERYGEGEPVEMAAYIRFTPVTSVAGTVTTDGYPETVDGCLAINARHSSRQEVADSYFQRRAYPFELVRSNMSTRPSGFEFADGRQATDQVADRGRSGLLRGSALVSADVRTGLAEAAMTLERLLGMPVTADWEMAEDESCVITRLLPAPLPPNPVSQAEIAKIQASAVLLCQGGQTVQAGVGAGKVVHVDEQLEAADFPAGAVAVARYASPQLTPVLQRAAAVVTEFGSAVGHLATVARELRLPAIFGLQNALNLLPQDEEITVHAGDTRVYKGILDILLRSGADEFGFSPFDREYRTLRRLLRFIMPLNLVDPESARFSPEGCRSFHDIIHFCHEKAVEELAHFQERRPGLGTIRTNRMQLGVPMDIRVLDIGGGMADEHASQPTTSEVRSQPFADFLDGLLQTDAWSNDLPSLGLRDIFSAMPRSMGMLTAQADSLGENLAIVGNDYINISLRLGYHFSVIDAHLGSDDSRNYVYFRFVGGLADPERRGRRARFIKEVLAAMDFKVSVKGDLVIGRKKSQHPELLSSALFVLGALTAFSKQRDTALYRDEDIGILFSHFSESFLTHYRRTAAGIFESGGGS